MSNYNKLLNNLEKLKLSKFRENLNLYIDLLHDGKKDIIEFLYDLTNQEIQFKDSRAVSALVRVAGFPFIKKFEDFDFSFQPSINKEKILDFKNLRFIENNENVIFVGSPGVGKTHLAISIGIESASNRYSTYFISCHDLIINLKKFKHENRLKDKLKIYAKYSVLIIDELGYLPIDPDGANLLFQLISKRYEKRSTIVTSNISFGKWGEIFGDNMIANAILDRLIHHSYVFNITGNSYRLKDKINMINDKNEKIAI